MGKVFQALSKAEKESGKSAVTGLGVNNPNGTAASASRQRVDEFDFMNFSLSAPPVADEAATADTRAEADGALAAATSPACEVTLDLARIEPRLVAFNDFDPGAAEQYDKLAAALISGAEIRPLKRLLISSAEHGEGRTTVALNLACALAQAKKRVLLIDADLHRPSVLRLLGVESEVGLNEAIKKQLPPGAAIFDVAPYGFSVLPTRERVDHSAEVLASSALREMLAALDARYDFLLFDSAPLGTAADASLLVRLTDAALLVIRAGKTTSLSMSGVIGPLTEQDVFGVVLNRAEKR
jgi:capsular exopolysaccharide synthesis family protein